MSLKKTLKRLSLISCSLRRFSLKKKHSHPRVLKHRYKIKNMLTVLLVSELYPKELRTVHHSLSRQQTNDNVTRREMRGGGQCDGRQEFHDGRGWFGPVVTRHLSLPVKASRLQLQGAGRGNVCLTQ